jgi:hypothetical protein
MRGLIVYSSALNGRHHGVQAVLNRPGAQAPVDHAHRAEHRERPDAGVAAFYDPDTGKKWPAEAATLLGAARRRRLLSIEY